MGLRRFVESCVNCPSPSRESGFNTKFVIPPGKARGDWWVLVYHAFISGGYTGLLVGGLAGLVVGIIIHLAVDSTNKFGLDEPAGPAIDQALHILTLVAIWRLL